MVRGWELRGRFRGLGRWGDRCRWLRGWLVLKPLKDRREEV